MEATIVSGLPLSPSSRLAPGTSALWARLAAFSFDQPGPYPFSKRLAKENEWTHEFALQVIEEYRKFIYLLATVDANLVASPDVELAWRLHLIYTGSYWRGLCERTLEGRRLEHVCEDGSAHPSKMNARFEKTLAAYRANFGEPPAAIWYEPEWTGGALHQRIRHSFAWSRHNKRARAAISAATPPIENIPAQHAEVWRKIKAFRFDKPGAAYPFSRRLADENGWDAEYTQVVIGEYRKFIYLLSTAGHMVTPSLDVDEAWHLHMENTESYWGELCGKAMNNRPIHHSPGNGSAEDERKFQAIYERTLSEYAEAFGEPPFRVWGARNLALDWREILRDVKE